MPGLIPVVIEQTAQMLVIENKNTDKYISLNIHAGTAEIYNTVQFIKCNSQNIEMGNELNVF